MESYSVKLKRVYDAPVEKVFNAWLDPKLMDQWHSPEGFTPTTKLEAKLGGKYSIRMKENNGPRDGVIEGEFREFIPNKKLVFTWVWQNNVFGDGETLVTVEFNSLAEKKTELLFTHELFKSEQSKSSHGAGWESSLKKLEKFV